MRSTQTVIGVRQGLLLVLPGLLVPAEALLPRCEGGPVCSHLRMPIDALAVYSSTCMAFASQDTSAVLYGCLQMRAPELELWPWSIVVAAFTTGYARRYSFKLTLELPMRGSMLGICPDDGQKRHETHTCRLQK